MQWVAMIGPACWYQVTAGAASARGTSSVPQPIAQTMTARQARMNASKATAAPSRAARQASAVRPATQHDAFEGVDWQKHPRDSLEDADVFGSRGQARQV